MGLASRVRILQRPRLFYQIPWVAEQRLKTSFPSALPVLKVIEGYAYELFVTGQGVGQPGCGQSVLRCVMEAALRRGNPVRCTRTSKAGNLYSTTPARARRDPEAKALGVDHRPAELEPCAQVTP